MMYFFDKPVPVGELLVYPARVRDYLKFYYSIDCLLENKNRIPDPKIIKMTYLDYIHDLMLKELLDDSKDASNSEMLNKFYLLMMLMLKIEATQIDFKTDNFNHAELIIKGYNVDGKEKDVIINGAMFEQLKNTICEYHLVDLPDEKIQPELEKALEDARVFKNKNNEKMGSLEDQFICIMISTSLKMEDINELTIRKFQKILERVDHKLHYQLYKTAEMNGTEFKHKIKHWMSEIQHDKYAGLIVDYDSTVNKFTK